MAVAAAGRRQGGSGGGGGGGGVVLWWWWCLAYNDIGSAAPTGHVTNEADDGTEGGVLRSTIPALTDHIVGAGVYRGG